MSATPDFHKRVREAIDKIPLLNAHDHLVPEQERLRSELTPFYLFPHYVTTDLASSGMDYESVELIRTNTMSSRNREVWNELQSCWKHICNTGYSKATSIAVRDLFGLEIARCSWDVLSEKLADSNKKGWYRYVLKEKEKIPLTILDLMDSEIQGPDTHRTTAKDLDSIDRELFVPVARFDDFVAIHSIGDIRRVEERMTTHIHCLNDWIKALECAFESRIKQNNIVGVKHGLAYSRILKYDKITRYEAERIFCRIFSGLGEGFSSQDKLQGVSWPEAKPLQDFMMHQLLGLCAHYGLPMQIHTGMQEGTSALMTNSNPIHLANLIMEYKEVKFDLMHGGYPYTREIGCLAKNFPNVYIDMSWFHILSPRAAKTTLKEWIQFLPMNKIFAFGGDYLIVEGTYGNARLTRQNVADLLLEEIEEGQMGEEMAIEVAQKLFWDNPYNFYNLKDIDSNIPHSTSP